MSAHEDLPPTSLHGAREITLLELLDRLLDTGVVLRGEITLAVADVDLINLDLALLLASAERASRLLMQRAVGERSLEPGS